MLAFSTVALAKTDDKVEKADQTEKVDKKGKTAYHNKKTDETIVQAFKYNEDGEFVEASLEEAMPYILESIEKAKEKEKEDKKIEDKDVVGEVATNLVIYYDIMKYIKGPLQGRL